MVKKPPVKKFQNNTNKPIIETLINTTALALTAAGTTMLLTKDAWGFMLIAFGMILEFAKYMGRQKQLW